MAPAAIPVARRSNGKIVGITAIVGILLASLVAFAFTRRSASAGAERGVLIMDTVYFVSYIPMAARDPHDLDVWMQMMGSRAFNQPTGMEPMLNDGRIVMVESRAEAALMWDKDGFSHIRLLKGPMAGTEGSVESRFVFTADRNDTTHAPPLPEGPDPANEFSSPGSGG